MRFAWGISLIAGVLLVALAVVGLNAENAEAKRSRVIAEVVETRGLITAKDRCRAMQETVTRHASFETKVFIVQDCLDYDVDNSTIRVNDRQSWGAASIKWRYWRITYVRQPGTRKRKRAKIVTTCHATIQVSSKIMRAGYHVQVGDEACFGGGDFSK